MPVDHRHGRTHGHNEREQEKRRGRAQRADHGLGKRDAHGGQPAAHEVVDGGAAGALAGAQVRHHGLVHGEDGVARRRDEELQHQRHDGPRRLGRERRVAHREPVDPRGQREQQRDPPQVPEPRVLDAKVARDRLGGDLVVVRQLVLFPISHLGGSEVLVHEFSNYGRSDNCSQSYIPLSEILCL